MAQSDFGAVDQYEAFKHLVRLAKRRKGCETDVDLSEAIGQARRGGDVTKLRSQIKNGHSPLFRNMLPLLEAAGFFASASGEAVPPLTREELERTETAEGIPPGREESREPKQPDQEEDVA